MIKMELEILKLLLQTYVEMVKIKATSSGDSSHMLAHHTEFIKREIKIQLKMLSLHKINN